MTSYAIFWYSTLHGIVLLVLYVDDIIITGSDLVATASLKRIFTLNLKMKDLDFLCYFLGNKVAYTSYGYLLS